MGLGIFAANLRSLSGILGENNSMGIVCAEASEAPSKSRPAAACIFVRVVGIGGGGWNCKESE